VICLLDNNVLSELWKEKPNPNVRAWFFSADWFLPVPVIAEIQEGAEASPNAARILLAAPEVNGNWQMKMSPNISAQRVVNGVLG